ncbi:MAG TPA: transaldolase [Planctomycetes bacterium]|nr:transaldolase [Planctomycetota bacterium]HIL36335.1 transaldolase [Planctomycetota bacterium]
MKNNLIGLSEQGQSVWFDFICSTLIESGDLARLVKEDGVNGVTSNPSIFEAAIAKSDDYDEALSNLDAEDLCAEEIYEILAIADIQAACDVLNDVYIRTNGNDGFVSLEVSPLLANDTDGTLKAARRLHGLVQRPNLMIKVPATESGLPAIRTLISEGIHVNVTLLFSLAMYEQVAEAYIAGLEQRVANGESPASVRSVASFFISRIDGKVDAMLRERLEKSNGPADRALLQGLIGKTAIANAKVTYARSKNLFAGERWNALVTQGAAEQRLLWASTSTKDPAFCDVLYVEELIGMNTVNTIPAATLAAFRDHGRPRPSLEEDLDGARTVLATLPGVGVNLDVITADLLAGGVQSFIDAYERLISAVEERRLDKIRV